MFLSLFSWDSPSVRATMANRETCRRLELEDLEQRVMPATFTVVNTNDAGPGSLRQAILDANNTTQFDVIEFGIPGEGVQTISPLSGLPDILNPVHIDGSTQPGFAGAPLIELDGTNAGIFEDGLVIATFDSVVESLIVNRFDGDGIVLDDGAIGNRIMGNYVGTDATGTLPLGNGFAGIQVNFSTGQNIIGGTTPAGRNIISGNPTGVNLGGVDNELTGNYVGTDVTGSAFLGNRFDGVRVFGQGNTIGGAVAGAGNVISGNGENGLYLSGSGGHLVVGNYIGTNAAGTASLGNFEQGIRADFQGGHTIGGTTPEARNVISGNFGGGILLFTDDNLILGNYIGTDATGITGLGNASNGLEIQGNANTIGGTEPGAGNVISGNGETGIFFYFAISNTVVGNSIGTDVTGTRNLGNQHSNIFILGGGDNTIGGTAAGSSNTIAFSAATGISVDGTSGGNLILGNSITNNALLGIDLNNDNRSANDPGDPDRDANLTQNFPVLLSADSGPLGTVVSGTLNSTANGTFRLEFFFNPTPDPIGFDEGHSLLGSINVTTDPLGNATFTFNPGFALPGGSVITATASDLTTNDTSEFSLGVTVYAVAPSVTITPNPLPPGATISTPRTFSVTFSEPVVGFQPSDVLVGGGSGANSATVTGSGANYTISVTGMSQSGGITVNVPAGAVTDVAGNPNTSGFAATTFGDFLVTGAGASGSPLVVVRDAITGNPRLGFFAYAQAFTGGVHVATGDFNGDGTPDIITGAGPGGGPHVRVFDGNTGIILRDLFAYAPGFAGGVFVASSDINADGTPDIITGAGPGGGPHVRVFDGRTLAPLASFFAYAPSFAGGVTVAGGDINGDGIGDIVTGAGILGSTQVKGIDGRFVNSLDASAQIQNNALHANFYAYNPFFTGDVFVATADFNGDGKADIITGAGRTGGSHVKVVDANRFADRTAFGNIQDSALLVNTFAYDPTFTGGVRVAAADFTGDGVDDLVVAPGAGALLPVRVLANPSTAEVDSLFAYGDFLGGVFVG